MHHLLQPFDPPTESLALGKAQYSRPCHMPPVLFVGCDRRYMMLFASILPWAAPLTLLYTLAKIKQVLHGLLTLLGLLRCRALMLHSESREF
jgi:hypothetical protein